MTVGDQIDHAGVVVINVHAAGAAHRGTNVRVSQGGDPAFVIDAVVICIVAVGAVVSCFDLVLFDCQQVFRILTCDRQRCARIVADNV